MQSFVSGFFARLETEGIPVQILRGGQNLDELAPGSDIDLVVEPRNARRLDDLLAEEAASHGVRVWERFHAGHLTQTYFHAVDAEGEHEFFEIDVHTSEACFGVPFLGAQELLDPETAQDCRVLANLLTPFLSGGVIEERYREPVLTRSREYGNVIRQKLAQLFGARQGLAFLEKLEQWPARLHAGPCRRALMAQAFAHRPLTSLFALIQFIYAVRIAPIFRPRGRFVALLGTDGSGKSTVIEKVTERLDPIFREGGIHSFHMRPGVLPQLRSLLTLRKKVYSAEEIANPHKASPSGAIGSAVRVLYYWLDFVFGYVVRVLPKRRRNALVIFDRYFDDYQVDPRRARIRSGSLLPSLLAPLTPRPDTIVICTANLDTVQARKQEHSREESARQLEAYEQLAGTDPRFALVDNSGSLNDTVNAVLQAIFGGPVT